MSGTVSWIVRVNSTDCVRNFGDGFAVVPQLCDFGVGKFMPFALLTRRRAVGLSRGLATFLCRAAGWQDSSVRSSVARQVPNAIAIRSDLPEFVLELIQPCHAGEAHFGPLSRAMFGVAFCDDRVQVLEFLWRLPQQISQRLHHRQPLAGLGGLLGLVE